MNRFFEDSRSDLINKSKQSDLYDPENRQLGKNRHQRRLKSRIANSVKEFNQINMNRLFKEDILEVNIRVNGETDVYLVKINFNGFLHSLSRFLNKDSTEDDLEFRVILRALLDAFNHNDVKVHCTCPDWQYRQAYWSTRNGNNAGAPESRPSDETNPKDTKGAGCKHINLILNNNSWMMKVASVIHNYIFYMKEHYQKLYADIVYPAIFEKPYEEPVQLDVLNGMEDMPEDELKSDEDEIDTSNKWAKTKSQFKIGNDYRFTKSNEEPEIRGQQKIFDIDSIEDEVDNTINAENKDN